MTRETSHWFNRRFDAGAESSRREDEATPLASPPSQAVEPPTALSAAVEGERLLAKAETLSACVSLARKTAAKTADGAGALGFYLKLIEAQESLAWDLAEAFHHVPRLDEEPNVARGSSSSGDTASLSASDAAGRPLHSSPSPLAPVLDIGRAVRDAYGLKVPEPQSLRVGAPKLRVVEGGDAA